MAHECSPPTCTLETQPERHTSIIKTEGRHFCQKKSVLDRVKGLGKIKVDNINCVTLVHHARHRFLEDQQIGAAGPKRVGNHADEVRLSLCH